ncbi:MAG: hypothetical protein ACK41O_15855 [Runella zeae]
MTLWLMNLGTLLVAGLLMMYGVDNLWPDKSNDYNTVLIFTIYYVCQCLNEWLFFKLFPSWRFGYWSAANLIAAAVWIGVLIGGKFALSFGIKQEYVLWVIIPLLGLISNSITGLGIHLASQTRYGL